MPNTANPSGRLAAMSDDPATGERGALADCAEAGGRYSGSRAHLSPSNGDMQETSVRVEKEIERYGSHASQRVGQRFKIFQPGRWKHRGIEYPLHLLDISLTGARAYATDPPKVGTFVLIESGPSLGLSLVAWNVDKKFGLQFIVPITLDTIDKVAGTQLRLRSHLQNLPPVR